MRNRLLLSFLFIILVARQPSFSDVNIRGVVLDQKNQPVKNAVVELTQQSVLDTTDSLGHFLLSSTRISRRLIKQINNFSYIQNSKELLTIEVFSSQNVMLKLFDLRGKEIASLCNEKLHPGKYRFQLPAHCRNQVLLLHSRIGSDERVFRTIGAIEHTLKPLSKTAKAASGQTGDAVADELRVTHPLYDEEKIQITKLDDSLTIQLYQKLTVGKINQLTIGETLRNNSRQISLTLDSINDQRCPCNSFCENEGNAKLTFTAMIEGDKYPIRINTAEKQDVSVAEYTFRLIDLPYCPQVTPDLYSVKVVFFTPESDQNVLFLEHNIIRDGTEYVGNSEDCVGGRCIDFPTYSYSENLKLLSSGIVLSDTAQIIFGDGISLMGIAGSGISNYLSQIKTLPFKRDEFTINSLHENGTVEITYRDKKMILPKGETWVQDTTIYDTTNGCIGIILQNDRISNFGFLYPFQLVW